MTGNSQALNNRAFYATPGGVRLRIRLTPNASREGIGGVIDTPDGSATVARVTALAEAGRANEALRKLIAKTLGVAKSNVELIAGAKSRIKTIAVSGDAEVLSQSLNELSANSFQQ